MAAIDYEIDQMFNKMASLSWELEYSKEWARVYEHRRYSYPDWITKRGEHIKIYNIKDSHLNNLISYLTKRKSNDSDKEAIDWWLSLFEWEKDIGSIKICKMNTLICKK